MRRQFVDRLVKTSIRRGFWGGSSVFRSLAVGMLVVRGTKRIIGRQPETVRRVKMRPGTSMSLSIRRGGRR